MAMPAGMEDRSRCELLTYLPADWEMIGDIPEQQWWPAALLKQLGQFVHEQSTWLGDEHTIVVSEPGETYAAGTLVSAALLRSPSIEARGFDELMISGTPCHFLWAFPITEAETNLKLERGAGALLELLAANEVGHVLDPARACVVTGRRPERSTG
jgi:hypothetical protein